MRPRGHWSGILVALLLSGAVSCTPGRDRPPGTVAADTVRLGVAGAANAGAGVAASGDRVVVTWAATSGDHTNVYAATSDDGGGTFAAPVRVNDIDGDARMSGEQAPRVALQDDLAVGWISRSGGQSSIRIARSADGGRSFTPARAVHATGLAGMRGWPSFTMGKDDVVHAAWLDTRAAAAEKASHAGHGAPAAHRPQGHQDPPARICSTPCRRQTESGPRPQSPPVCASAARRR